MTSHPFQEGVGGCDESSKRGVSQGRRGAPPITAKGRGWGSHIMLICRQSAYYSTIRPTEATPINFPFQ